MRNRWAHLLATVGFGLTACGGGGAGKIMADTPALPYQAPDIDEITGIDPDEEPAEPAEAAPAPAPAPAPTAAPAAPAPTPKATPAPKTLAPKATPKAAPKTAPATPTKNG